MDTNIRYAIHRVTSLPAPYGNCFDETTENVPNIFSDNKKKYDHITCHAHCIGQAVLDECKCIDVEISSTLLMG